MSILNRFVMTGVIGGFLALSSGCIIAPGHEHDRDREVVVEHDDHHHCDEHDRDCHER